jgi:hypothetical protein
MAMTRQQKEKSIDAKVEVLLKQEREGYAHHVERSQFVISEDEARFDACLTDLLARYFARGQKREPQLSEFGYNRASQLATFDCVGTTVYRLATWKGLKVPADRDLYPSEFIVTPFRQTNGVNNQELRHADGRKPQVG